MYASWQRAPGPGPGRSLHRSRTLSDPGSPYVAPPFKTPWPAPARRATEPMNAQTRSSSRNSSVERLGDPFVPPPGSLLAQMEAHSPVNPSAPVSPSSASHQHHRSSSRQGSISRMSQAPLIQDVPQPPRTALNAPGIPTPQISSSYTPSFPVPQPNRQAFPSHSQQSPFNGMAHQGSSRSIRQGSNQGLNDAQYTLPGAQPGTQNAHHSIQRNGVPHTHSSSHHSTHRSRSRPPSAASHRYASSITQPMYGHGSSGSLNASRTSLNGTPPKNHVAHSAPSHQDNASPPAGIPSSLNRPSPSSGRSRPHRRSVSAEQVPASSSSKRYGRDTLPEPAPPISAKEIHHTPRRMPDMPTRDVHTRYVNMLLALDDIPNVFNIMAYFFTWILLAGFLLFPGTFTSLKTQPNLVGAEQRVLSVILDVPLFVMGWICTGVGAAGMVWLWWRWQKNYIWIVRHIFVPGLFNSLAGIISVLANIYGIQSGTYSITGKSTIIVTVVVAGICGCLVFVYQFWLLRNIKREHDREVGVELAGKHGEGVARGEMKR